jgi:hypothetical protein
MPCDGAGHQDGEGSMSRWFRIYDEMLDDPKMQRLPPATFKAVINLWCLTSKNGGKLPCFEDIAFGLRLSHEEAVKLLDDLVSMGLFDHDNNGLRPHNWDKRQYKSDVTDPTAAQRMQRHRNAHRNAAVTVTHPRTDTESEQIQKEKNIGRSRSATRPEFDEFWKVYPKRGGANPRFPASLEFDKAVKGGADPPELIAAAKRYADEQRKLRFIGTEKVAQAKTWLHQRRWEDYPPNQITASVSPLVTHGQPCDGKIYIRADTEEWDAWCIHLRQNGGHDPPRYFHGGWKFPSRWPPNDERQARAQ